MKHPILIVTCGNPDAGDDGFGHAVAERLRADPLPGVTVRELGIRPADLLEDAGEYKALIIVDAVSCPGERPGALMDMDWFDPARPVLVNEAALSSHGMSLGLQLDLLRALGMLPSVVRVVGSHMARVEMGYAMTEAVQRSVSAAVGVIRQHARVREADPDD